MQKNLRIIEIKTLSRRSYEKMTFNIAEVLVSLSANGRMKIVFPSERQPLTRFLTGRKSDFKLTVQKVRRENFPSFPIRSKIFSNETTWSYFMLCDENYLWIDAGSPEELCDRAVLIDKDFTEGIIYVSDESDRKDPVFDPISYPLDQFLMINLLGKGKGMLVHACGIDYRGNGILFVGNSGAGKTTIANLFDIRQHAAILNDDRIIVRFKNNAPMIYGTPWHGTGRFANPAHVPLKRIFFLKHALKNNITPLKTIDACTMLFTSLFPPFWDPAGITFSLDFCAELAGRVPCNLLTFRPDESAADFLEPQIEN